MTVTLPSSQSVHHTHDPFPLTEVYIIGFDDTVSLFNSLDVIYFSFRGLSVTRFFTTDDPTLFEWNEWLNSQVMLTTIHTIYTIYIYFIIIWLARAYGRIVLRLLLHNALIQYVVWRQGILSALYSPDPWATIGKLVGRCSLNAFDGSNIYNKSQSKRWKSNCYNVHKM